VLYSEGIHVTHFEVPDVRFSDHRPLICDFEITGRASARADRKAS
jgi:endonuclease/exonuclease/phosphatase (EEP) superfamily protein YafD